MTTLGLVDPTLRGVNRQPIKPNYTQMIRFKNACTESSQNILLQKNKVTFQDFKLNASKAMGKMIRMHLDYNKGS